MTTDTALGVTKLVVSDKSLPFLNFMSCSVILTPTSSSRSGSLYSMFNQILFLAGLLILLKDFPTIVFNARESVEMPFRARFSNILLFLFFDLIVFKKGMSLINWDNPSYHLA